MKRIILYTDGACSGNPGPGGWGCVLIYNSHRKELSGGEPQTTNNRMEIQAVIQGLSALKEACIVEVHSDSAYVCNAINEHWIDRWTQNGWLTASKKPVENSDLWKKLIELMKYHSVSFIKVKGHSDNIENNLCDKLATAQASKYKNL